MSTRTLPAQDTTQDTAGLLLIATVATVRQHGRGAQAFRWEALSKSANHEPCLPHLVTGYMLENAFKHGDVEHPDFLRVVISLAGDEFRLEVTNRIGRRNRDGQGGIGLKNMNERLETILDGAFELAHGPVSAEVYRAVLTVRIKP